MNIFIPKSVFIIIFLTLAAILLMAFSKTENYMTTTYETVRITHCSSNWLDWDCVEEQLNELSKNGWTVVNVTTECQGSSCLAIAIVK